MITLNKNLRMDKLVCIKTFNMGGANVCIVGKTYDYWTNFGGLNHFIRLESGQPFPFKGPYGNDIYQSDGDDKDDRPYIFDYFCTVDKYRDNKINKIIDEI